MKSPMFMQQPVASEKPKTSHSRELIRSLLFGLLALGTAQACATDSGDSTTPTQDDASADGSGGNGGNGGVSSPSAGRFSA